MCPVVLHTLPKASFLICTAVSRACVSVYTEFGVSSQTDWPRVGEEGPLLLMRIAQQPGPTRN